MDSMDNMDLMDNRGTMDISMPRSMLSMLSILFVLSFGSLVAGPFDATSDLPVAHRGRFSSLEPAARIWLYDFYHRQSLKQSDLSAFHMEDPSAISLLWNVHFFGHTPWNDSPFFWIHYATHKTELGLPLDVDRFSYDTLLTKRNFDDELSSRLQIFKSYRGSAALRKEPYIQLYKQLEQGRIPPNEMANILESRFPLITRLKNAGTAIKMLPLHASPGEWVSLHALKVKVYDPAANALRPIGNFTPFSDADFTRLRDSYLALQAAVFNHTIDDSLEKAATKFAEAYTNAYESIEGKIYKRAEGKTLAYPSIWRLKAERLYYRLPLIEFAIAAYIVALILMAASKRNTWTLLALSAGFAVHTAVLIMRCYILQRPPVSNMFETVVYVPWIAMILGLIFYFVSRNRTVLAASTVASLALLVLLQVTQVDARMENVQAVLDSQYWLIIHVLMVVGSYGAFIVSGILAHFYLARLMAPFVSSNALATTAQGILHTMYVGVALLIPGTILGGVWAAESWGRFWDWDPKESWAFISACVYLLVIHAYTFNRIRDFGLAVGAIAGLMAVSFTWYGVNYVLGTGLHSYGFGKGGEFYYFVYIGLECTFLACACAVQKIRHLKT